MQDSAAYDLEGQKLKSYTEISSALSEVSDSTPINMNPSLESLTQSHAQSKQRVENDFEDLGDIWEKVFDVFVSEIALAIDDGLAGALVKLTKEGNRVVKQSLEALKQKIDEPQQGEVVSDAARCGKRDRSNHFDEEAEREDPGPMHDEREQKRPRLLALSSFPSVQTSTSMSSSDVIRTDQGVNAEELGDVDMDSSVKEILQKMKLKIDRQAQSLQTLTKENTEVCSGGLSPPVSRFQYLLPFTPYISLKTRLRRRNRR